MKSRASVILQTVTLSMFLLTAVVSTSCRGCNDGPRPSPHRSNNNGSSPTTDPGSSQSLDSAQKEAIGAVVAHLRAPVQKTETEQSRFRCSQLDLDTDTYKTRCKESPPGSGIYYKTNKTPKSVTVPSTCRVPGDSEGTWEATLTQSSGLWRVWFTYRSGSRDGWTVNQRTRKVESLQPPC